MFLIILYRVIRPLMKKIPMMQIFNFHGLNQTSYTKIENFFKTIKTPNV